MIYSVSSSPPLTICQSFRSKSCTLSVHVCFVTDKYTTIVNRQYAVNYAVGQAGMSVHFPPNKVCTHDIHKFLLMNDMQ